MTEVTDLLGIPIPRAKETIQTNTVHKCKVRHACNILPVVQNVTVQIIAYTDILVYSAVCKLNLYRMLRDS